LLEAVQVVCDTTPAIFVCGRNARREVAGRLSPSERDNVVPLEYNNFQVRLAGSAEEIDAAQALRYRVFYEEMAATPTAEMRNKRRDFDSFDSICDHLLVIDREKSNGAVGVVGTYRLLRRSVALCHDGFYSAQEYDLSALLRYPGEIVELGRSCVDSEYRSGSVMQMLWRGLAEYVREHHIHVMFGCASFPGTKLDEMGAQLSYLHHFHMAPRALRPRALDHHYVSMGILPRSGIDAQAALSELPPLIKGYLRVGGFVGDGAVVDHQFNTTDVCVIVKTDQLTEKYDRRYRRHSAYGESL
jgi:putative hemolysin